MTFEKWLVNELPTGEKAQKGLAKSIMGLSDIFKSSNPTPWGDPSFQQAYTLYYMPLNLLRFQKLLSRLDPLGFLDGIDTVIDIGSGPGTFGFSLQSLPKLSKYICYELDNTAIELQKKLIPRLGPTLATSWVQSESDLEPLIGGTSTLVVFSYSLNEFKQIPTWLEKCQNLLIIEPSTHQNSRKLIEVRQRLIDSKLQYVWAPCTHQKACPLLKNSKTDFCHDRVNVELPKIWIESIEKHLPIKNRSLTMSYLATSKVAPKNKYFGRITGDPQKQKGKTIQMFCRGEEKEFLSWLKKSPNFQDISRGDLVVREFDFFEKSNELRPQSKIETLD
ncbi:MAG: small ribosomal subunit Rsm22 family protein [Bdellovibrionales bacterium]